MPQAYRMGSGAPHRRARRRSPASSAGLYSAARQPTSRWLTGASNTGRGRGRRELALLARRHELVAGRHHHRHRRSRRAPSHGRESKRPSSRPASAMSRAEWRISSDSQPDRLLVLADPGAPHPGPERAPRGQRQHQPEHAHRPERAPARLVLPVLGRPAEHHAGGDVRVVAGNQLGDRASHRVSDDDRGREAERSQHGGGVGGAVDEPERDERAQPAPVAAVVDRQHAIAGAARSP